MTQLDLLRGYQETSREAYAKVRRTLNSRQAVVFEVIADRGPLTNQEIADLLGWGVNRVTPRCLELRGIGCVEDAGKRTCSRTGNSAKAWRVRQWR